MDNTVFTKTYTLPEFDIKEIMRYAGLKELCTETEKVLYECIEIVKNKFTYKVCYSEYPISSCGEYIDLSFISTRSENLKSCLDGCSKIIVFAATIGIEADRIIAKYLSVSPVKALLIQAIATERIESLCDMFCNELRLKYKHISQRFSPGYGDFPIEHQKDIFRVLDCPRKIGLTLNQSLLMSPSKSVTAIIGISDNIISHKNKSDCTNCNKMDCEYRRTK